MGITANSNHRVVYPHCNFSLLLFDFGACVCMLFCVPQKIPLVMAGRRPGDAEIVYASTDKAEKELNWR